MPGEPRPRLRLPTRRVTRAVRLAALLVVLFGPIGLGAWHVHVVPRLGVDPVTQGPDRAKQSSTRPAPADRVADYLDRRDPVVDQLLPEGRGGTRFYEDLGGDAGRAFIANAAIALATTAGNGAWPEAVEVHERAHLLRAFFPAEAGQILAALPPPAPAEYAATNPGEHFAEMAATAWAIAALPEGMCLDQSRLLRLEDAERRVPGTAGFVARFVRRLPPQDDDDEELRAMADRLSAPQRDDWNSLWRAIDARRRPDGSLEPLGPRTVREWIDAQRATASSGGWIERIAGASFVPSLIVLAAVGR